MSTNLAKTRKQLGLSQAELAARLGVSRPTYIKTEKGERQLTQEEKEKLNVVVRTSQLESANHDMRINIPQEHANKFRQVLLYILTQVGAKPNVGLTVLYKLLYFIDFDYYEKYGQQLMGLTYFRNTYGPTPRSFAKLIGDMKRSDEVEEVRSKRFTREQTKFLPLKEPDLSLLTGRELEMIDDVLGRYADKSARYLSDLSHRDIPWKATEEGKDIDYELAFYRSEEFSVREYDAV